MFTLLIRLASFTIFISLFVLEVLYFLIKEIRRLRVFNTIVSGLLCHRIFCQKDISLCRRISHPRVESSGSTIVPLVLESVASKGRDVGERRKQL